MHKSDSVKTVRRWWTASSFGLSRKKPKKIDLFYYNYPNHHIICSFIYLVEPLPPQQYRMKYMMPKMNKIDANIHATTSLLVVPQLK